MKCGTYIKEDIRISTLIYEHHICRNNSPIPYECNFNISLSIKISILYYKWTHTALCIESLLKHLNKENRIIHNA